LRDAPDPARSARLRFGAAPRAALGRFAGDAGARVVALFAVAADDAACCALAAARAGGAGAPCCSSNHARMYFGARLGL
jgi:hypothetical protein